MVEELINTYGLPAMFLLILLEYACFPVSSLTFIASLKTMKANRRAKTNCVDPYPFTMPMEFANAATDAEWLEGIPPLVKKG